MGEIKGKPSIGMQEIKEMLSGGNGIDCRMKAIKDFGKGGGPRMERIAHTVLHHLIKTRGERKESMLAAWREKEGEDFGNSLDRRKVCQIRN